MTTWDDFPKPAEVGYLELKFDGDEFTRQIKSIETAEVFDKIVPRLVFEDDGNGEQHFDFVNTMAKNKVVGLAPAVGTWIHVRRNGKVNGKRYVDFTVETVEGPASASTPRSTAPAARADAFAEPPF